ncbi:MAG: 30S ribosomal protein S8 [Pseudomonadota bacterium]|nr:30S ribosomal protein S8 [Pseudomonadota bacterium]
MSMSDPIADMLTRLRNGQQARKQQIEMPLSKTKRAIAQILLEEGYIADYRVVETGQAQLIMTLKYYQGKAVIASMKRISRPGLRIYRDKQTLPKVMNGLGIAIISTSKGLMTDRSARSRGLGGEVLCFVA